MVVSVVTGLPNVERYKRQVGKLDVAAADHDHRLARPAIDAL